MPNAQCLLSYVAHRLTRPLIYGVTRIDKFFNYNKLRLTLLTNLNISTRRLIAQLLNIECAWVVDNL